MQTCPTATNVATIFSLPCVKGGGTVYRDGGIVKNALKQPLSHPDISFAMSRWQLPLHRGAYRCGGIAQRQKPLWNHPLSGWFSWTNKNKAPVNRFLGLQEPFMYTVLISIYLNYRCNVIVGRDKFGFVVQNIVSVYGQESVNCHAYEVSGSANVWYYFLQTGNKNPNELSTAGGWFSVSLGENNSGTCLPLFDLSLTRWPFKPQFPHLLSRAINSHSLVLTIKWHIAQVLFF